jgi:hypothetical protein
LLSDLQRDLAAADRSLLSRNDPRGLSLDPMWPRLRLAPASRGRGPSPNNRQHASIDFGGRRGEDPEHRFGRNLLPAPKNLRLEEPVELRRMVIIFIVIVLNRPLA